ncbi:translation initiation factor IF-3 [PVC group bacterium]|nr:translation initiation factor IF-3 [PVC group bacterium]
MKRRGSFRDRYKDKYNDKHRVNEQIRIPEVRVIDDNGEQLGVMEMAKALQLAQDADLDLVEVSPKAVPPVCRIIDYGKFVYQQSKRAHEAKKKQKTTHLKEVKVGPNIDDHDLLIKLKHAREFLEHGDKLKITIKFRGREMRLENRGRDILKRVIKELEDVGQVDMLPKKEGRQIFTTLSAKSKKKGSA